MHALARLLPAAVVALGASWAAHAAPVQVIPLGGSHTFTQQVSERPPEAYSFAFDLESVTPQLNFSFFYTPNNGNQSFASITLAQFTQTGALVPIRTLFDASVSGGTIANGTTFSVTGSFAPLGTATDGNHYLLQVSAMRPDSGAAFFNAQVAAVPEPHEWAMMLAGLGLVGWAAKRRREPTAGLPAAA